MGRKVGSQDPRSYRGRVLWPSAFRLPHAFRRFPIQSIATWIAGVVTYLRIAKRTMGCMMALDERVHWSICVHEIAEANASSQVGTVESADRTHAMDATGGMDESAPVKVSGSAGRPGRPLAVDSLIYALNPDDSLRTASVGKLFLLAETMRQCESGDISLTDVISRDEERPDDFMEDSGLLYMLAQRTLDVADLCVLIGAFSDNYATNLLVERVGLDAVQRCARDVLGYRQSNLLDKVRWERPNGVWPEGIDDMSRGCASELCDYMVRMHCGTLISPVASARIERWLAADADTSMTSGAFDVDPLAHWPGDAGFRLRHKTGTESDVRCDVGVVTCETTGTTVAWAVLANWDKRRYGDLRDVVLADMRALGERIRAFACAANQRERDGIWD